MQTTSPLPRRLRHLLPALPLLIALSSRAQDHGFGAGLMLGEPTGISMKAWTASDRALGFGLAWSLAEGHYLHLHADYLFHKMDLIHVNKGKLPLYFGPGLRLRSWNNGRYWYRGHYYETDHDRVDLSFRFPVGLAYLFDGAPVDVFLEIVPTLELAPQTDVDFDGAIGARFWFN